VRKRLNGKTKSYPTLIGLSISVGLLTSCSLRFNTSNIGNPNAPSEDSTSEPTPTPTSGRQITTFQIGDIEDLDTSSTSPIGISLPVTGAEDLEGSACSTLGVLAIPSEPSLFDTGSFALTGTYPNCTLQIRPAPGQCGSSSVTLSITVPGQASSNITFNYTASGRPHVLKIENAPDGIGVSIDSEPWSELADGSALVAYAVVRNQCGQFVRNQSVLWELSPSVAGAVNLGSSLGASTTMLIDTSFAGPRAPLSIPLTANHADFDSETATLSYQFSNSDLQLWLDAQASDTLFQDLAQTMPATQNNDPLRLWLDQSGKDRHATQWSESRTPVLNTSGARPTLTFTKDCLKLGSNGEDFDILDSNAFTAAFVVSRGSNANAPSMNESATYPNGRFMPLISIQDFTEPQGGQGLLRVTTNHSYAVTTQYRTDRETPGEYWFAANSRTENGGQCFGSNAITPAAVCNDGNASEAAQVLVARANVSGIHQQILRSGTLVVSSLGPTKTDIDITSMRNTSPTTFPAFLGCDYDQSAGAEFDGIYVAGGTTGHFPFTGTFSEVIIYNRYLSDADTVTLVNSLASKWGL
jgi:hypothetical protein